MRVEKRQFGSVPDKFSIVAGTSALLAIIELYEIKARAIRSFCHERLP